MSKHFKGCYTLSGDENRDLLICANCSWSASLLLGSNGFNKCPNCDSKNIEVVPVNDSESYNVRLKGKTFEIDFQNEITTK